MKGDHLNPAFDWHKVILGVVLAIGLPAQLARAQMLMVDQYRHNYAPGEEFASEREAANDLQAHHPHLRLEKVGASEPAGDEFRQKWEPLPEPPYVTLPLNFHWDGGSGIPWSSSIETDDPRGAA